MAKSRDARQFSFPAAVCFNTLLAFLPLIYVRVEPFTATPLLILTRDDHKGEIKAKAEKQVSSSVTTQDELPAYYHYTFSCEANDAGCKVEVVATTPGITDVGLGQQMLRQFLITLNLALTAKMPSGTLPLFFVSPYSHELALTSSQVQFEQQVNYAFQLSRRGQADKALTEFQKALALNPNSSELHFHVGVLLLLLGYLSEAQSAFRTTLQFNPQHVLARAYLQDVQSHLRASHPKRAELPAKVAPVADIAATLKQPPIQVHSKEEEIATPKLGSTPVGTLLVRPENGHVREHTLDQPVTVLGRQHDSDILLLDPKVSRHHAQITCLEGRYLVLDLNSVNGTYYNGRRLAVGQPQPLYDGDSLKLGNTEIVFAEFTAKVLAI